MRLCFATLMLAASLVRSARAEEPRCVFHPDENVTVQAAPGASCELRAYDGASRTPLVVPADGVLRLGRLPRGYYELTGVEAQGAVPIAVVPRPRRTRASRIATDAAHAWLIGQDRLAHGADLLARAGMAWARERFTWGEVEPARGRFDWARYDRPVDALRARGIRISEVFHNIPAWSRADGATSRYPDDLRDVYRFGLAAASHFRGRVDAWEIWNEADIPPFSVDEPAEYSAFLKAAYLGMKTADPGVKVAQVSLALASPLFHERLYRNGTASYFDLFNYHIYAAPTAYPARVRGHFAIMDAASTPASPVWLTEAGVPLRAVNGSLSPVDRRRQAEFIPRAVAMALAAGTDRFFFFVFPHYLENGVQFGLLDSRMRPYPGYAALAAAAELLGEARYLGRVEIDGDAEAQVRAFGTGHGTMLVLWREGEARRVRLPYAAGGRSFSCVGAATGRLSPDGLIEIGAAPVYVELPVGRAAPVRDDRVRRRLARAEPRPHASPVVVRLRLPDATLSKQTEGHMLAAGASVEGALEVYNFGARSAVGAVRLSVADGWRIVPESFDVDVAQMGRMGLSIRLTAPSAGAAGADLVAVFVPRRGGAGSSPASVRVMLDPATVQPGATEEIGLGEASHWAPMVSGNGTLSIRQAEPGTVEAVIGFAGAGDRWGYPSAAFEQARNWTGWDGVSLELHCDRDDPEAQIRLIIGEKSGAAYLTDAGWPIRKGWRRVVVLFDTLGAGGFAAPDPNGKLDLDQIAFVRLGCNTPHDGVVLRFRNLRLIRVGGAT